MKTILLSLFLCLWANSELLHKYYFSLTEINYNEQEKSLQIITNVFIDDFETALNKEFNINAQLANKNEIDNCDTYIYNYLKKQLSFKTNKKNTPYIYIGKEYDGDIVYFYLEIKNIHTLEEIEIRNTLLLNEFPKQQNLVKVKKGNQRKSLFLDKNNSKDLLIF